MKPVTKKGELLARYLLDVCPTYEKPDHLAPLCDVLGNLDDPYSKNRRLVVHVPPQHGTTTLVLVALLMCHHFKPGCRSLYATYDYQRAKELTRQFAALAEPEHQSDDSKESILKRAGDDIVKLYDGSMTMFGSLRPTCPGGYDTLIIDTPLRHFGEAADPLYSDKVFKQIMNLADRCIGPCIVVGSRLHPRDVHGRLIDVGWESLCLPMVAGEGDPWGRAPGELLWPGKWGGQEARIKRDLEDPGLRVLFQGDPSTIEPDQKG